MTRRILLVDDELAILLTLKAILEMNGFDVETASFGARSEAEIVAAAPSIWSSPICAWSSRASGFEVIRAARSQAYNPATAILTAYPTWKATGRTRELIPC